MTWMPVIKDASVWIKPILSFHKVKTLEGLISSEKGDYLCKGIEGERWATKKENLERCYSPTGNTDGDWKEYKPNNENCNFKAAELNKDTVIASQFGKLSGKKGDFILKEILPDSEDNERLWIVNKDIFSKTYKFL